MVIASAKSSSIRNILKWHVIMYLSIKINFFPSKINGVLLISKKVYSRAAPCIIHTHIQVHTNAANVRQNLENRRELFGDDYRENDRVGGGEYYIRCLNLKKNQNKDAAKW